MHPVMGGYSVSDIEPVAAFDVDAHKVGKDLGKAIFEHPNCTVKFSEVPELGVEVMMSPVLDGVPPHLQDFIKVSDKKAVDVPDVLKSSKADILVNFIPTGSKNATRYYADACIKEAKVGFVNGIPELIACDPEYQKVAEQNRVPLVGDDVKSQVGATILHRSLVSLFLDRGVKVKRSYQLNYGGNTDFANLVKRGETKEMTKLSAVKSMLPYDADISAGFGFIPILKDTKIAVILLEGEKFGGVPIRVKAELEVIDSPNSAGVVIDAIRCAKIAIDRAIGGALISPSAYFMKHPPKQFPDEVAKKMVEEFIAGKRER
jgi:myo-inositol-1-phosphate synthase